MKFRQAASFLLNPPVSDTSSNAVLGPAFFVRMEISFSSLPLASSPEEEEKEDEEGEGREKRSADDDSADRLWRLESTWMELRRGCHDSDDEDIKDEEGKDGFDEYDFDPMREPILRLDDDANVRAKTSLTSGGAR